MKFTVITVALNAGDKLNETVQSVLSQTMQDWELLVKDGLSTDGSVEQLPKDDRIRVVSQKDRGIYDAMNQAVACARGEYVIFLNCGDFFYDSQVLHHVSGGIDANPGRGIYYGNAYFRLAGEVLHMPAKITPFTCFRHIPCHQACIFERSLFDKKAFDLQYKIRADYDFFLRQFFQNGAEPCDIGITIVDYEGGGYSETKENRKRDRKEHGDIIHKYMSPVQIFAFRAIMVITLQPLRKYLSQRSRFAGTYDRMKKAIYRK